MGAGCLDWRVETFSPTLDLWSIADNHQCKEASMKAQKDWVQRASRLGKKRCFHMTQCWAPDSTGIEAPLFRTSPYVSLQLAVEAYPLISFVINR